jgi:hypothetical protein
LITDILYLVSLMNGTDTMGTWIGIRSSSEKNPLNQFEALISISLHGVVTVTEMIGHLFFRSTGSNVVKFHLG